MSGANSAPVFEQRAAELGIPGELVDALRGAHVNSFARLAYLTPYQPGQPDDQVLFDKLEDIAGRGLQDFEKACFRQLFYEASAITVSELKQKVERVESSEPATLPLAERMHRMEDCSLVQIASYTRAGFKYASVVRLRGQFKKKKKQTTNQCLPDVCL